MLLSLISHRPPCSACTHLDTGQECDHGAIIARTHHSIDWAIQVMRAPFVSYLGVAAHRHQPIGGEGEAACLQAHHVCHTLCHGCQVFAHTLHMQDLSCGGHLIWQ